jgi:hypothetical protein
VSDAWYDTAQICLNGHIITACINRAAERGSSFCEQCGAPTVTKCPKCDQPIRGYHHAPGEIDWSEYKPPAFCPNCGHPYPWTERRLAIARSVAESLPGLTGEEQGVLIEDLDNLVRDTPATPLAVGRLKKLLARVGTEAAGMLKSVLVDVLTEATKKAIWPK